jgi:hypothetical protein
MISKLARFMIVNVKTQADVNPHILSRSARCLRSSLMPYLKPGPSQEPAARMAIAVGSNPKVGTMTVASFAAACALGRYIWNAASLLEAASLSTARWVRKLPSHGSSLGDGAPIGPGVTHSLGRAARMFLPQMIPYYQDSLGWGRLFLCHAQLAVIMIRSTTLQHCSAWRT